ncbi:ParA family protein [Galbibacter sp. EGI 63066]|uniref:ParA family protein n=1 Tax=Galbibacter sp. EGI 63066 TaxID=2993559 RepID=UPI0022489280|nr:ParA family protein [Galbibacter sp. EGI 63066]MCX2680332.1 ParA family protein [Galbibacter sp. EGI 63066]
MTKIISIANFKGGVGKTTTAINLAAALRDLGKKTLLIDVDPQANLTQSLGIKDGVERSIYDILHKEAFGEDNDLTAAIVKASGLDVIPSSLELANAELELASIYGREQILAQLTKSLNNYDFVFIDCPPAMGMLTINALVASDTVLLPLQAEFLPLKGVRNFLKHFDHIKRLNKKVKLLGFVLTKFDKRKKMNRHVKELLESEFSKDKVFKTHIRINIALANAQQKGMDIYSYDKNSNGAMDYKELAKEFLLKV